jgi:hypothetical protein
VLVVILTIYLLADLPRVKRHRRARCDLGRRRGATSHPGGGGAESREVLNTNRPLPQQDWGEIITLMSPAGSGNAQFRGGQRAPVDHHPARSKWRWLVLAWLFGLGLVVISGLLPAVLGYLVILGSCVFLGSVLGATTGDLSGLRDHRQ